MYSCKNDFFPPSSVKLKEQNSDSDVKKMTSHTPNCDNHVTNITVYTDLIDKDFAPWI